MSANNNNYTVSSANTAQTGQNAGNAIKSGITKIHGAGEALRGNINAFVDGATNTDSRRSQTVADRGESELKTGVHQHHGTGAGVTPNDTAQETLNRNVQADGRPAGTF